MLVWCEPPISKPCASRCDFTFIWARRSISFCIWMTISVDRRRRVLNGLSSDDFTEIQFSRAESRPKFWDLVFEVAQISGLVQGQFKPVGSCRNRYVLPEGSLIIVWGRCWKILLDVSSRAQEFLTTQNRCYRILEEIRRNPAILLLSIEGERTTNGGQRSCKPSQADRVAFWERSDLSQIRLWQNQHLLWKENQCRRGNLLPTKWLLF